MADDRAETAVLLLEDSQIDAELARSYLAAAGGGYRFVHAVDRPQFEAALAEGAIDIILADYLLPGFDGLQALAMARDRLPNVPFLFVSGVVGEEFATDALKRGATDYVMKRNLHRLPAAVDRALTEARERSERRRAEQALRASEVGLRLAVDAARLGLWDLDPATGRMACDRRCCTLFGILGEGEIDFETFVAGCHPEDRHAFRQAVMAATDPRGTGEVVDEHRTVRPVGAERWVATHGRAFFDAGVCTRVIGVVQDVTARKRTEATLRRVNEDLEARVAARTQERDQAWRLSRDLMVVKRLDTTPVALNPAWQEVLGWREEELMAGRLGDLVHPEDRSVADFVAAAVREHGVIERFENRYRHRDGSYRWIAWSAVPADDLVYAVGRDVTEEKQATAELAAANRELRAQIEERERIEATLRQMQRLEAVGQLTSGVAHDFNNLLTIILGNIGFAERAIERGAPTEPLLRRLGHMRQAAERGAKLTDQLLSFSRRQRLEPKPTDLNETVEGMRDLLQSTLSGSVQLRRELSPDLWPALVDPTQIELIILNLAINARDAMRVGGRLTIATSNVVLAERSQRPEEPGPGEYVMLSVADTGTGMTPEVLERAFEPFFTTKKVGEGSGLGLAQVFGFAKQSGGGVGIETVTGEGTTVRVYLPRAGEAAVVADRGPDPVASGSGRGRSILVVDDDDAVRDVTASRLRELGYRVVEADSGGRALDILADGEALDLLLLDYAMPGMNGAELAREARRLRPDTPVMFITGFADLGALGDVGEERIVPKPYSDAELAAKVARVLG